MVCVVFFLLQAEDGIRVAQESRGLGDVYKRQRQDLAGKTGTTSDAVDGWFSGYANAIVSVAWMGYDEPRSLGSREFGSTLALPIWIDALRPALALSLIHI